MRAEVLQEIAAMLDHPNVYMGGPSQRNMRRAEQIYAVVAPLIAAAERGRMEAVLRILDFDGGLDAWANLKGALIDMEHAPTEPPDAVCWNTLNRVLGQLSAVRAVIRALP